jgi:hypothetical protein
LAYDNTNRWTLNKNDRKEKDTHPDYKGSINVDGVDYWLDGWIKDGANGKFISGSIKAKEARAPATPGQNNGRDFGAPPAFDDDFDGIPF